MTKSKTTKKDNIFGPPSTTGSIGTSTSSNITIESSDIEGDGTDSLIPDFKEDKSWSSTTTSISEERDNGHDR